MIKFVISVDRRMKTRGSTSKYTEAFNLEI